MAKRPPADDRRSEIDALPATAEAPPPEPADALPEKFGRYRVLRRLGRGGMGTVYLAHDSQLDRPVALKVPHVEKCDDRLLKRFRQEAQAAATLQHPNVCPVYDVGEVSGVPYVSMAYVDGKPLSALIRTDRRLPPRPVAAVVRKLALALHEAHKKGIIHRDLKPANVMVNERGEPVLMDFGLARRLDRDEARLTREGAVVGTPAYMAPEQIRGEADGPSCDVYGLGVILYEMLTGRLPFDGPVTAVLGRVLSEEPPTPRSLRPDLDPRLDAVCRKAMAKRPSDRYASMAAFAQALTDYLRQTKDAPAALPVAIPVAVAASENSKTDEASLGAELLAKLLQRLETTPVPAAPRRSLWPFAAAGVLVLLLLLAGTVYHLVNRPPKIEVKVEIARVVNDPAVVAVELDGNPITKEELARKGLPPGPHVLTIRRADGSVETLHLNVAAAEAGQPVEQPPAPAGPYPGPATWHVDAFDALGKVVSADHNSVKREVVWSVEAKDDLDVNRLRDLGVRFFDADDVRIADYRFAAHGGIEPAGGAKKGKTVRFVLRLPSAEQFQRARKVIVGDPAKWVTRPERSLPPAAEVRPGADNLPAGLDAAGLAELGTVVRADHDAHARKVAWLLEAKHDLDPNRLRDYGVRLFDADGVRIHESNFAAQSGVEPATDVKKGQRVRLTLTLPGDEVFRRVRTGLVGYARAGDDLPEPPPPPVEKSPPLPSPPTWSVAGLEKVATVLRADHDAGKREVVWLLEAKQDLDVNRLSELGVRFFDADDVRVYGYRFAASSGIEPPRGAKKGRRLRLTLHLPADELFRRSTKVIVDTNSAWPGRPEFTVEPQSKVGEGSPPPSPPEWDTSGFGAFAKLLRTDHDPGARRVVWLLEAKHDLDVNVLNTYEARFLDANGKPVHSYRFSRSSGIEPPRDVRKGQRLRLTLQLPAEDVVRKAKKVVIAK